MTFKASLTKQTEQIWLRFGMYLPLLVLVASLSMTYLMVHLEQKNMAQVLQKEFDSLAHEAASNLVQRMDAYQQMLRGVGALFSHAANLQRKEFHNYIDKLQLAKAYPGIQGVAYVQIVPAAQLEQHIASVRKQGFPAYSIRPAGKRDVYTTTLYTEPLSGLNQRAFGYDTFTIPAYREAMELARDSGEAALSGHVRLRNEEQEPHQVGQRIYFPLYRYGMPTATLAERRANIIGWIYSPFLMEYLLTDVLSEHAAALDMEIYDGKEMSVQSLLHDPDMHLAGGQSDARFKSVRQIGIANHTWTMAITSLPDFGTHLEQGKIRFIAIFGIVASLLLALISWLTRHIRLHNHQLAVTQASYSSMFDNTLDAAFLLQDQRIVNCNNMATVVLDRPRSTIIGHKLDNFSPLVQPDGSLSRIRAEEKFSSRQANSEQSVFEWQFKRFDGTLIYCDIALRSINIAGQMRSFVSFRDITSRKQGELAQLHSILESSPDAVILVEEDGNINFANRIAEKMFGFAIHELLGLKVDALVPMRARSHHTKLRSEFKDTSRSRQMGVGNSLSAVRHDGSEFPVEISLSPIKFDEKKMTLAIVHDITVRKRVEMELINSLEESRKANQRLSLQFNRMPLAYIVWDRDFVVTEWNPAAEKIFGWPAAEAVGQHAYKLIVPADVQQLANTIWEQVLHGEEISQHSINENTTRSGKRITCEWFNTPLRNEHDDIYGCMSMVSDITQRKVAENELIELNERLELRVSERTQELARAKELAEAGSHAKSEFLANMSHEIRTPMNSVLGMAYLALKTDLTTKQRDYLEKIHYSGEHLLGIINDILDFSKIEAGKLDIEKVDFKLDNVIRNLSSLVADKAHAKGLQLTFDMDPGIAACMSGDPLRLSQVLINYTNNAIKFTPQGQVIIRAKKEGQLSNVFMLRFEVQDNGIDLKPEEIEKLFQPFQQADGSITRKFGGTGLGLAISKRLVNMMGGDVGVTSQPGMGSTFWFTARFESCSTPACCVTDVVGMVQNKASTSALKGARILLADDNLFNQQVGCELLEEIGALVTAVNNGAEVLDSLRRDRYDCVLMDVQMPVMDGLEATRQIRAEPAWAKLPVIAMTANARAEDKELCFAAGMDDFLTKPLLPERLYATLEKWLSAKTSTSISARSLTIPAASPAQNIPATSFIESMLAGDSNIIDLSVLAKMLNDDPVKIRKFAGKFMETADKGMTEIEAALAQADFKTLAAVGHRIKSAARTVGAMGFADLCQALEQHDKDHDLEQAKDIVGRQQALLALIKEQINAYLA